MKNQVIVFFILILLSACNQTGALNNQRKEKITHDIIKMFGNYHDDIKKDGLLSEFKYLDRSDDFYWVPPGYTNALSYDSVKSILETNAKSYKAIEFNWDTLRVFPLSYTIANYSGIVKGCMIDTANVKSSITLIESGTVIKRIDGWKILSGQSAVLDTVSKQ